MKTLEDMEKLVYKICNQAAYCEGCDEAESAAFLAFARAYNDYDPSRGNHFSTMLWYYVQNQVRTECRNCVRWKKRNHQHSFWENVLQKHTSSIWDRFRDVSDDAREVVHLIRTVPEEFMTVHNLDSLAVLRTYLAHLGWTMGRIKKTFSEIREALQ